MPGALMQLVAYGAQDTFLTGNPQITFFRTTYRRHTNFANVEPLDHVQFNDIEYENIYDINKWTIKFVIILETDRNMECPINLEPINLNDQYCRCSQCKHNFSKEALVEAFKTNHTCPMCRSEWNDKTVYVNKQMEKNKKSSDKKKKFTKTTIISSTYKAENKINLTKNNKRFFYGR
jgi:hypothetical protein